MSSKQAVKKKRPPSYKHRPTPDTRKLVFKGIDDGLNLREIGKTIGGITAVTVKKYYGKELETYVRGEGAAIKVYQANDEDRTMIENLVLAGYSQDYIATCIGTSLTTLKQYYREELTMYLAKRVGLVARQLVDQAERGDKFTNGNAIFLLKCRAGWRDNNDNEVAENLTETMKDVVERLPD